MKAISSSKMFGGEQKRFTHTSTTCHCNMTFSVYLPPQASQLDSNLPVLYWLSGLTCTDENFVQKSFVQKYAAEKGIVIVAPDTSPRGDDVPCDPEGAWDFGLGAGFYVNATEKPWVKHYQMYSYVVHELPSLIKANFNVSDKKGIFGHSMGGHGALTVGLNNLSSYTSISAFAPITNPMSCLWGKKAFSHYLGDDQSSWRQYDASWLITHKDVTADKQIPILVDQGEDDAFLHDQLYPERLEKACELSDWPLTFRMQPGYDHSYFFIATFMQDHIDFHAKHLLS